MHSHPEYTKHIEKTASCLRKRWMTRNVNARACRSQAPQRVRTAMAKGARQRSHRHLSALQEMLRRSYFRSANAQRARDVITPHLRCRKTRVARTLSRSFGNKKFSWIARQRLIRAHQNRTFSDESGDRSARPCLWWRRSTTVAIHVRSALALIERDAGDALVPLRDGISDAELALEQVVDGLRIGLAGRLHHLADEPADHLRLGFRLRHLVRIG